MRAEDFLDGASNTAPMSAEDFLGPNDSGSKPPKQNAGIVGDIGTALKRGVLQMPGMATGLADIAAAPVSIATGVNRPVSRAADWLGEQTGFQPGKWAEAAGAEYSPEMQQAQQNVEQAKGFFPTLGAVAQNPRVAAQVVAESLPSTIAGGLVARGAMGAVAGAEKLAALRTAAGSADAAVANAARRALLKSGAIAAGVGEGAVTAGQQMAQTGYDVDPALAAGAAIGAGVGTGIIGGLSGRVAGSAIGRKLGLSDIETSMAAGTFGENAGKAGAAGYAKRIGAGAIQEGLLEEAPQSYQEQVWQNLAAGKQLTEGAAEAAALGAVAGGVMGGGVNAISGPLTKAVAAAPVTTVPPTAPGAGQQILPPNASTPAQETASNAGIASAAQFPQFTAPPQPVTGGAPLEQAPTAMPVPQATQNAPAAPGSPSPVSAADPLPSAKQAEAAGAPQQRVADLANRFEQAAQGLDDLSQFSQQEVADVRGRRAGIAAGQRTMREAKLEAADARVETARQKETEARRNAILDGVDLQGETNIVRRFEKALAQAGIAQNKATPADRERLARRVAAAEGLAQDYPPIPAAPNELLLPDRKASTASPSGRREQAIAAFARQKGVRLKGNALIDANGRKRATLTPREIEAVSGIVQIARGKDANQTEVAIPPAQGPEAAALPVAAKPAKGIAAALQYPQQVTEGGGPLAQQAADMPLGRFVKRGENGENGENGNPAGKMGIPRESPGKLSGNPAFPADISRDISTDIPAKKATRIASSSGIAGALVTPQQPTFGGAPLEQTPTALPIGKYGKTPDKAPATYKGMTVEQMAKVASQHGHAYEDALQKIKANPGRWVNTVAEWRKADISAKLQERKLKRDESFEPNEKQKKVIDLVSDSPTYSKDRDLPMAQHNARSTQTLLARGVLSRIEHGDTVEYRVNSKAAPVASRQTPPDAPQQPLSGAGAPQARRQPQPAPIMRRDDLVGAIMRVTGGDGIASNMALTIAGDTAGRGLSKLRGLFTNRGTIDLGEVATRLREDEGFDVRDGEHLSELIRAASFGDTAVSMERAERDQDTAEEKRHREYIRQNAKKLKIKSVAVKFSDLEQRVIAALTRRHERAVELLDERAKRRFDAALEESYALLPEDVVDAVLVDVSGRGLSPREFWNQATETLRYMVADAKAQKEQEALNAIEGAEPDWLKDDDRRGNQPAGGGEEVNRVAEEAGGESGFSLAAQTPEEIAAAEAAAKAAEAKADKEKKAAEDAQKKAELTAEVKKRSEAAADTFELGGNAMDNLTGQKDIFAAPAPAAKPNPDQAAIDKANADFDDALNDLGDIIGKPFRANFTPEQEQKLIPVLTRLMDAAFRKGYYKFKEAARFVLESIGAKFGKDLADQITLDHLQGAYIGMAGRYKDQGADSAKAVVSVEDRKELEAQNVTNERSGANLERDSQDANIADGMGAQGVPVGAGGNGGAGRPGVAGSGAEGSQPAGGNGLRDGEAAIAGERGNLEVHTGATKLSPGSAGNSVDLGGDSVGVGGLPIEPDAASRIKEASRGGIQLEVAKAKQREADKAPFAKGLEAIRQSLPILTEGQQEDVFKTETRFAVPDGYGMLFTNGTGTGKTFSALGVIKRFSAQGKQNILVVAPSQEIISAWQKAGKLLGLDLSLLEDINDAGSGMVITTYANMGANNELASRDWDLIVHDEAHYLSMNKDGTNTESLNTLRAISLHPDGALNRAIMLHGDIRDAASIAQKQADIAAKSDDARDWPMAKVHQARANKLNAEFNAKHDAIKADVAARQLAKRPRVMFLSATPFAYEKSVDWANGYLFDYNEGRGDERNEFRGYNTGSNRDQFMMQHFGYRMRYGKLTAPDAKVDSGLMQRQFNSWLKKSGSLSGRMLDVDADYDRRFILVDSAIGQRIDEALQWFDAQRKATNDKDRQAAISAVQEFISEKFDYLSRRYLLESIKAKEVVPHVREHLAMGRKVVVFHDYKKGGGFNPFIIGERTAKDQDSKEAATSAAEWNGVVGAFNAEFKDIINSDLFKQTSPILMFKNEFPGVLLFNGDVSVKDRRANVQRFQDDASGPQVILVQSAAGKEGISLHDTTGKHQRVLFNLGQPTQPTTAIQQEGRIYRTGQVTDAIFRYLNTGTNWEKWAFATTIANRASAAENLGMGELARSLKDAFIAGFEESDNYRAGMDGEGKGGKERDKAANNALTEYDRARAFYFGTQKKNGRTKAQEGADYFATPEPVGLKMVEWANVRPGEKVLEPSAGHGAIARWMPTTAERTAVEPSMTLRPRLAMVFDGQIIDSDFESLNVVNKYDAIVMNPPFGSGGKTAIDHLAKAATHLRDGGRIVALLPTGPAADKKFEKWFYEEDTKPVKPLFVSPNHGPIYKGDTFTLRGQEYEIKKNAASSGSMEVATKGGVGTVFYASEIPTIKPTGKRETTFKAADGLSLVADIKLPQVTFERAGTAVSTRIVVIEKSANSPQQTNRDFSDVADINTLFDRLENMALPDRAKEPEPEAAAAPAKKEKAPPAQVGDSVTVNGNQYAIEIYTTNDGKDKRGIWMEEKEAKAINPRAFKSSKMRGTPAEGKFFVDEYWLNKRAPDSSSRFSFAGQQSATADQFQLGRAKQLLADGANANSVRQQTGWFKNPSDGKWRYEIDDSGASLKAHGFGFGELLDALGKNLTLAEVLDHPALFAAYPSIAGSSVETIDEKSQNNGELVTNKDGGFTIRVNAGLGEAKALSVMLHEIQHGIQNVEGFASGGNIDLMAGYDEPRIKAIETRISSLLGSGKQGKEIAPEIKRLNARIAEIRKEDPYQAYRKLAGEVESRNVQQRQNFPADKRRLSDPLGTQDVAPEDVIVMFNGKDAKDAPAPANTTRASAMASVGASPADAAVFDMASEGKSAQEILAFLSKASRRPFNRVLAAALSRIGVASTVSIDPAAGWRNNQNRQSAKFAASYSPKTDTVALYTPREAERHILHEFVHSATLKAIARGGLAARQMQAVFDHVQKSGTMSDQYGMGNFARFKNETDAQFKKRALDEFTAELFTNPQFQVRLKQLQAPSGSKLKSAWDWIVRVIANMLGLKTRAQETALDRALSVGAALLQENAALTMPPGQNRYSAGTGGRLSRLIDATAAAKSRLDAFDKGITSGKVADDGKYFDRIDAVMAAEGALAGEIAKIPDDDLAVRATTSDGRMVTLTKSAQQEGKYQITRFDAKGEPWGDTLYPTKLQAAKEFVSEVDVRALEVSDGTRYHTTWHGSPHKFYTFDLSKIGTGEGAQAYGHGLYVAEAPEVAKSYSGKLSSELKYNGRKVDRNSSRNSIDSAAWALYLAEGNKEAAKMSGLAKPELIDALDPTKLTPGGQVYKVDLPTEAVARMLDWDAGLHDNPRAVKIALEKDNWDTSTPDFDMDIDVMTGEDVIRELFDQLGSKQAVSDRLLSMGIVGTRYLDKDSRDKGKGTSNFVLFDDKLARIIEVNGVETGVQPWQPGEWEAAQSGERFSQEQPFSGREVAATPLKPGNGFTAKQLGEIRDLSRKIEQQARFNAERAKSLPEGHKLRATGIRALAALQERYATAVAARAGFDAWFGKSKAVGPEGDPLVLYHGTTRDITAFKRKDGGRAIWAADSLTANSYAGESSGSNVLPVFMSIQNPLVVDAGGASFRDLRFENRRLDADELSDIAEERGYDGLIIRDLRDHDTDDGGNYPADHYAAFSPTQVKSATSNTGTFSPEDPDIRYSLATNWQQSPAAPGNLYQAAKKKAASLLTPERLDKVIYETQDKFVDLRRIRDHIKEIGGTITDLNDAYLGEELYHKRLAERSKQFLTDELRPFLADMNARGVEMPEFEKFLHARHAPEANDEMAKRNPNQKQIDAGRQKSAATVRGLELNLQTAKARGLATVAIEKALNDARAELAKWNGAQAFKGTEAERLSLSGMSNADASALMASLTPSQRANMNALAAKVDAINEGTLQTLERYGLMDKAAMNTWRNTYKHYVPLHRDEAHPDSASHPIGQGFNVRGDASKRRTGSNQEVTNIFGHIAMQREAALTRGEKNRVMQKLYLMARQNPIADIWSVGKVPMIDTIDKASGFVRSVPDPQYKDKPNVITLRIAGKDVAIVMNEYNPQALRLAQSIKNLDVDDLHYLIPVVGKATRWFASINTQYNPIFGLINFARDVQTAALNLSTTAIAGKQKEVFKDTMSILGDIIKNKGRMPTAGKWAPIYKEFNEVGGTTGYRDLFLTAEDRSKAVADEIKALDRGKVSQAAHAVAGWLSDYNEAMENATRLAAYKAAIDNGMSKERAASLAKNLTVNFNRKGRQTRELGALYAFFNAAVQGTARMAQTLSGPAGKKIMFGGVLAGAASAMAGIAAMGGGDGEDDEWSKIPEFVKERSLIIPSPFSKEGYFAIPMPLGFHFLPNIGRLMVEMAVYKDKTLGKQMASLFTVLADAFNPLGGSAPPMQIIAPTVMDPFIALAQNKDWTGKPIYVENFNSLNPQPGAARAKDSATPIAKGLADAINAVTGGTKYVPGAWSPTPDQIDYVIGQLTGGVGRELGKLSSTIAAPFTGDELPAHKIPLLGRLYGSTAGATGQAGKFYENIKRANEVENELKGRRKDGISADDYLQDNPKAVELAARGNAAERQIRALRQMRSRIVEAGGDDAASKARQINERMATVMRSFNMQVERMQ